MNIIYIISGLCLQMASAAVRLTMPVVLIDNENSLHGVLNFPTNPFHKMDTSSFSDIIRSATYRSERIIIFVEEQFSIEDITTKDRLGTSYHHLHQGILDGKVKFIPSVYEPYKTIKQMFPPLDTNVIHVSDDTTKFDSNFKYYFVYFQDNNANETRVQRLRRHDKIIRKVFFTVRQLSPGPVVAFYTGKVNPAPAASAAPAGAEEPPPTPAESALTSVMIVTDAALFWLSGVYTTVPPASYGGARRAVQAAPALTEQSSANRRMSTRMLYSDFELEFGFTYRAEAWELEAVTLLEGGEEVGRAALGVGAPWDWAFYCAEPICIYNSRDKSAVIIEKYQLEPLRSDYEAQLKSKASREDTENTGLNDTLPGRGPGRRAGAPHKTTFGRTLNCGPYFSASILACLMVVAFLLSILFYGITMLMNCQTNSNYDDMNQKPLVIVAQL